MAGFNIFFTEKNCIRSYIMYIRIVTAVQSSAQISLELEAVRESLIRATAMLS